MLKSDVQMSQVDRLMIGQTKIDRKIYKQKDRYIERQLKIQIDRKSVLDEQRDRQTTQSAQKDRYIDSYLD